ncbi:MAG TPA: hypothetical protein PKC39_13480 [Ferruginibacter sp.]|nr:hypothetical protein [Ferruginibacter sp.]HMP21966.1 hypothetical protein [Ferruginibacter sp.]
MTILAITMQDVQLAVLFVFFICIAWLLAEFKGMKDELKERLGINNNTVQLRLQAYERLTLFAERISLKHLVTHTTFADATVVDYQLALLETIRAEYEYNVSQQIYVSHDMWKAIGNLKDQNTYIINQVAAILPSSAPAVELSRRLLEYAANPNAELSPVVLEALQFEAKKLL